MQIQKIALGYWYQRTTLHLAEIHDFLIGATTPLDLKADKLTRLRADLHIKSVRTDIDVLERLDVEFANGIKCRIYEDGLVLLSKNHHELKQDIHLITRFFEDAFLPAIKYLFSLGAPVPRELAGVKALSPVFIVTKGGSQAETAQLFLEFGHDYAEIANPKVQILKGGNYYLINLLKDFDKDEHLIESLIFFKEFKAQLHHYLNVHRVLWEKIEDIKEQGYIRGKQVEPLRSQLESYKKTIELIAGRLEQMNMYVPTRSTIVSKNQWEDFLTGVLEFQYHNLDHTLGYVKSLWKMTMQYLDSAIQIFTEMTALSTRNSVNALTIISSIGVVSGVIGFLAKEELPVVTRIGLIWFGSLLIGTVLINHLLKFIYSHIKYKISDVKLAKLSSERKL